MRWLLNEAVHSQGQEITPLYLHIAVAGMRAVGFHPEDHKDPSLGGFDGGFQSLGEGLGIGKDVVRRGQQHRGFSITLRGDQRGGQDGGAAPAFF